MDIEGLNKSSKRFDRFFAGIVIFQIILAVVALRVTGGVIFSACHFIAKFW